jgi:hypothetical protein
MTFARRVYTIAGIYGLAVLVPQYVLLEKHGRDFPPPITHAEYYYGFVGIAIAWQLAFLVIATDPIRYRPLMLPTIVEKAAFAVPAFVLYSAGRLSLSMLGAGVLDALLGVLFAASYLRTPSGGMHVDVRRAGLDGTRT